MIVKKNCKKINFHGFFCLYLNIKFCAKWYVLSEPVTYVCAYICGMRESNRGQTVCGASGTNLGGNSGSFWVGATMPM